MGPFLVPEQILFPNSSPVRQLSVSYYVVLMCAVSCFITVGTTGLQQHQPILSVTYFILSLVFTADPHYGWTEG